MTPRARLSVACAADAAYAMPLAVAARSLVEHLSGDADVDLYVLDGGLGRRNRARLLRSVPRDRIRIVWVAPDAASLAGVRVSGHVSIASYFRLLLPEVLPDDLGRVIYLDADVVVARDLLELWRLDLGGHPIAAAPDWVVPTLGAANGLATHAELGLEPDRKYFNAGVLLIDLDVWRRRDLSREIVAHLVRHEGRVRWWDQDGLNAILAREWVELDLSWNVSIRDRSFPPPDRLPCSAEVLDRLLRGPAIFHYATHVKPWHTDSRHPRRDLFFEVLDRTAWRGWRPRRSSEQDERLRRLRSRVRAHGLVWTILDLLSRRSPIGRGIFRRALRAGWGPT